MRTKCVFVPNRALSECSEYSRTSSTLCFLRGLWGATVGTKCVFASNRSLSGCSEYSRSSTTLRFLRSFRLLFEANPSFLSWDGEEDSHSLFLGRRFCGLMLQSLFPGRQKKVKRAWERPNIESREVCYV